MAGLHRLRGLPGLVCAALLVIVLSGTTWAAYVTDTFEITLRSGPTNGHKIVAMLRSGQAVQVLEKNDAGWALVRVLDGPGKDKEGWVISRYLMERVPWEKQAAQLRQENTAIKSSMTESDSQWLRYQTREKELTETLEKTSRELETLKKEYQALREGSADYLKLKEELDKTQAALAESQALAKRLTQENESLALFAKREMVCHRSPRPPVRLDHRIGHGPPAPKEKHRAPFFLTLSRTQRAGTFGKSPHGPGRIPSFLRRRS